MTRKTFVRLNALLAAASLAWLWLACRAHPGLPGGEAFDAPSHAACWPLLASLAGLAAARRPRALIPVAMLVYLVAIIRTVAAPTPPGFIAAAAMAVFLRALGAARLPPPEGPPGGEDA